MTPTNWNGILALCAIFGALCAILKWGTDFGKMTKALESVASAVQDIRGDMRNVSGKLDAHEERFRKDETRLDKLEFCLDIDGQAESVVTDVMKLRQRRRPTQ